MINPDKFVTNLISNEISFFTGVPDSLLKHVCACIADREDIDSHVIAANEGAAIGLGIGHYLGTRKIPFIYLQNSGLGNTINPIISLASPEVCSIPMVIMIGWRGEPNVKDEPQHIHQGRIMIDLLDCMEMPYEILETDEDKAIKQTNKAICVAKEKKSPVFLVVKKNSFENFSFNNKQNSKNITREEAIKFARKHIS